MSKTVVITGCSTGFGREAAEKFARQGARVYATMRGVNGKNAGVAGELQDLAAAASIDLRVLDLDVTATASVDAAAAKVLEESGAPDVVINNAGQMFVGITEAFDDDEFARQLDINVVGVHRVTRAFLPAMRERGDGLFINVTSVAGRVAVPFFGVYNASKWGLESYSEALKIELASSGVDVVVVEPGPFTTELFPQSPRPADADGRAQTYPEIANETFDNMGGAFEGMFNDPEVPTDPSMVVDRFIELVGIERGTRPFRSPVGFDFGVGDLNTASQPYYEGVIDGMGIADFAKLRPKD